MKFCRTKVGYYFGFLIWFENKVILLCVMDEVNKLFVSRIIESYYEYIFVIYGVWPFLIFRDVEVFISKKVVVDFFM